MKKRLLIIVSVAAALCLVLGAAVLLANGHVRSSAEDYLISAQRAQELENVDCILVLGCGVRPDGEPSLMLRDRLNTGLALYEAGAAPKLLMSGDHGRKEYDEVNAMKAVALNAGVPAQDIFLDHAGFSTYESMVRAVEVFQVRRVIVVSQRYHLYRAVYDARAMGLEAWGVAAEDIAYAGQLVREAREILARAKDCLYCIVRPDPTFLGEAIPISGNGEETNG